MPIVMRYTQLLSAIVDYGYKTLLDRVTMSRISDYYGPAQYYCPIILSFIIIHFIYFHAYHFILKHCNSWNVFNIFNHFYMLHIFSNSKSEAPLDNSV